MQHLLLEACATGDTITFSNLHTEDGSVLDQRTGSQDTPLHLASRFNHKELASMIINLQPDMAVTRNEEEETPLHEACRAGGFDIIELLLNHRPSLAYCRNRAKESALLIACSRGHSQVAFKLANMLPSLAWDQSGSLACLLMAASEGDTVSKPGMKVHAPNKEGMTAIDISNQNSIWSRGKHTAAQVDADVLFDLKCKMLFLLYNHILAVSIGVNPDPWNQKNDIPETEYIPWWFSTALTLFWIASLIVLFHDTFPLMIQRPWSFVEVFAVGSMEMAFVGFLLKIADGDPLFQFILSAFAFVPLMGFCWIWHKLDRTIEAMLV
ncbi:hypothetical protein AAC387_Pa03g3811 [Persea americana]